MVFISAAWAPRTGGCDYDGRAAKACLSDYEGLCCSDAEPSARGGPYTGSSCNWGGDWTDDSSGDTGR